MNHNITVDPPISRHLIFSFQYVFVNMSFVYFLICARHRVITLASYFLDVRYVMILTNGAIPRGSL